MRLGLITGYSGAQMGMPMDTILEAERAGFDSAWTAEAYGSDAITPLSWIGALTKKIRLGTAIMQMPGRTPAMTAMTAMTLDALSGGRFILGIGPSGPQVVEGWHGVSYGKPLQRTREYIEIVRAILAREVPVEHHGKEFDIPYTGPGASGLGKPLKSILHGRKDMQIYTASISPKGIALAGEIADGVIPVWMNPERWDIYDTPLKEGFAKTGGKKSLDNFDVAPFVQCHMGPDVEKCRMPVKGMLALYIGGMGARSKNFYNDYVKRMGYEDVAGKIQDLFLAGKKAEAMALVPNKLVDEVALVGNRERIADQLKAWKASPVKTMLIGTNDINTVRALAEICL
jgi:F420-dependent oxidoreductase-like protein